MAGRLEIELVLNTAKAAAQYKEFFESLQKSAAPKISFDKWLSAGDVTQEGEKAGKRFGSGLVSGWGKSILTGKNQLNKFWADAVNFGTGGLTGIKGLRDVTGKDLAKVMGLPDITSFDQKIDKPDWKKVLIGLGLGFSNPYIGSRLLSDELGKGSGGGIAGGLFGKGGIAGFSEIFLAFKGFKFAVDLFKKAIDSLVPVFDFAHKLYGKSLSSGLSLGFTAKRQISADILGVSENDVMRFKQGQMVMNQTADAVSKIARTAPDLAYTWAQFKILGVNILADAALLSDKLTPALDGFAVVMEKLLSVLEKSGKVLGIALEAASKALFGQVITDLAKTGISIFRAIGLADLAKSGGFGQPQSFIKQLPAGAFEKMGLVIGGGVADKALEYQRRTATTIEKIYQQGQQAMNKKTGYYMSRSPFVAGH